MYKFNVTKAKKKKGKISVAFHKNHIWTFLRRKATMMVFNYDNVYMFKIKLE